MLTFSTSSLSTGGNIAWGGGGVGITSTDVTAFGGFRVVVDDALVPTTDATNGDKYPVYMFAPGTIAQGIQRDFRIRYGENILSFQDVMACDWHGAMAIMGVGWNSADDNPEDSDLATPGNWALAYDDSRLVPAVKVVVNCRVRCQPVKWLRRLRVPARRYRGPQGPFFMRRAGWASRCGAWRARSRRRSRHQRGRCGWRRCRRRGAAW